MRSSEPRSLGRGQYADASHAPSSTSYTFSEAENARARQDHEERIIQKELDERRAHDDQLKRDEITRDAQQAPRTRLGRTTHAPPADIMELSAGDIEVDNTSDTGFAYIPVPQRFEGQRSEEARSSKSLPGGSIQSQAKHDGKSEEEFNDPGEQSLQHEKEGEGTWQLVGPRGEKRGSRAATNRVSAGAPSIVSTILAKAHRYTMSPEQERDHWKSKFEDMENKHLEMERRYKQENGGLKTRYREEKEVVRELQHEREVLIGVKEEFRRKFNSCARAYEDAERRASNLQQDLSLATEKNLKEREQLRTQIDELHTSHIRSVNTVGTGLDPIAEDVIGKRFTDLTDDINSWCRRAFKGRPDVMKLVELEPLVRGIDLAGLLGARIHDTDTIRYAHLIETITWGYVEEAVFSIWFPAIRPGYLEPICSLQDGITAGDKSLHKERKEFWRAYTCSLLFQNDEVAVILQDVDDHKGILEKFYESVQRDKKGLPESHSKVLRECLRRAVILAAELKCQRVAYEIENNIQVGDPYDEGRMTDIGFDEEKYETPVVSCILFKGCVRRPFAGSDSVYSQVYKARVLVEEARR